MTPSRNGVFERLRAKLQAALRLSGSPDPLGARWLGLGFGLPAFTVLILGAGSLRALGFWAALMIPYVALNLLLQRASGSPRYARWTGALFVTLDLWALTALLVVMGQLSGPLAAFYLVVILGDALIWPRRAIAAAVGLGLAAHLGALALVEGGYAHPLFSLGAAPAADLRAPFLALSVVGFFLGYVTWFYLVRLRDRASLAESNYRAVFEAAMTPMFVVDAETGRTLDGNSSAWRTAGAPRDELLQAQLGDLLEPESRARFRALVARGRHAVVDCELQRFMTRKGREFFMEITVSPTRFRGREAVVVAALDRTAAVRLAETQRTQAARLEERVQQRTADLEASGRALREAQSQLLQVQRISATGEIAGAIAHAIFNPLTVLIGRLEMRIEARRGAPDADDRRLLAQAQRIAETVDGMLTLSRRGKMSLAPLEVAELVAEVRAAMTARCERNGVRIEQRIAPDLPVVWADRTLLATALGRVVENGIDAMPNGGKLRIDARLLPAGDVLRLRVRDSGPGVSDEARAHLFELFYSTRARGVGLGLAIARSIILAHEGSIQLGNAPSGGAELIIEIPIRGGIREALGQHPKAPGGEPFRPGPELPSLAQ